MNRSSDPYALLVLGIREVHGGAYRWRILLDLGCSVRFRESRRLAHCLRSMVIILTFALRQILVYVPLYFWSQGRLSVDPARWWRFRVHKPTNPQEQRARQSQALAMLA